MDAHAEDDRRLYNGEWVDLRMRTFVNAHGTARGWEYCTRKRAVGAVAVAALTPGENPRIVLVEQFRPPLNERILEFPAGLVEPGDRPEETALRELEEETGCRGRVLDVGPAVFESPGLTNASVAMVTVLITSRHAPRHEPDEDIRIVDMPLGRLLEALRERNAGGVRVDAKLWCYAWGRAGSHSSLHLSSDRL